MLAFPTQVRILRELDLLGSAGLDASIAFDHLFLCGDLNYRLGLERDLPDKATAHENGAKYWSDVAQVRFRDQTTNARSMHGGERG